ncbi:unnamed protein product [Scytosiphon promiscuus]
MNIRGFSRSAGLLTCVGLAGLVSGGQVAGSDDLRDASSSATSLSCIGSSSEHVALAALGDGMCDHVFNTEACGYDGGDCCACTCQDGELFECGVFGFMCVDEDAPCVDNNDEPVQFDDDNDVWGLDVCITEFISDNDCDPLNNNEACGYDGGDCCPCTCEDADGDTYHCGENGFSCLDPDAPCNSSQSPESASPAAS